MTKPNRPYCGSTDHPGFGRRAFLGGSILGATSLAADMSGLECFSQPAFADQLKRDQNRVILLWLAGGASQLETWDPKPGRDTGGPFRAIPTSIPGVHISELMPKMASRLSQHTAIIRSLNTRNGDHGGAAELMLKGRRADATVPYPDLGAMIARELGRADSSVPEFVAFYSETEGRGNTLLGPGFLGSRYAPIQLFEDPMPQDLQRLSDVSEGDFQDREQLRKLLSQRFLRNRGSRTAASHNNAYERVRGLMASDYLFDIEHETQQTRDLYGPTRFGQQCLVARRLVEAGVPFVRVARAWWDSHGQNFETHLELVSELDHVMSVLLDDLQQRGLLENTLVITVGEFGRTPQINASLGRDHFATAWSCSLSGCGIRPGTVYGATDLDGNKVTEGEMNAGDLFATIFRAVGIDPQQEYQHGARPIPLADPGTRIITDILA
ncbi:MAG: DUF1501 domain-containing protein [Pirellula sp.]